jgi:hypothetical protein
VNAGLLAVGLNIGFVAHPGSDCRFPYSENLPMGMSAKSIG